MIHGTHLKSAVAQTVGENDKSIKRLEAIMKSVDCRFINADGLCDKLTKDEASSYCDDQSVRFTLSRTLTLSISNCITRFDTVDNI
jgi:hypothetical protein